MVANIELTTNFIFSNREIIRNGRNALRARKPRTNDKPEKNKFNIETTTIKQSMRFHPLLKYECGCIIRPRAIILITISPKNKIVITQSEINKNFANDDDSSSVGSSRQSKILEIRINVIINRSNQTEDVMAIQYL